MKKPNEIDTYAVAMANLKVFHKDSLKAIEIVKALDGFKGMEGQNMIPFILTFSGMAFVACFIAICIIGADDHDPYRD